MSDKASPSLENGTYPRGNSEKLKTSIGRRFQEKLRVPPTVSRIVDRVRAKISPREGLQTIATPDKVDHPFLGNLVDTNLGTLGSEIKSLEENPEKLLRFKKLDRSAKDTVQRYATSKRLFYELRDRYRIAVPSIDTVIGKNMEGEDAAIIVTDRIHGKNLDETTFENDSANVVKGKFDGFFDGMVGYYIDRYKQGGNYVADVKGSQFMYGRRKGESEDSIYYVDIEPFFRNHDPQNIRGNFFTPLQALSSMMDNIEGKMGDRFGDEGDIEFSQARRRMRQFLDEIPAGVDPSGAVTRLKDTVAVEKSERAKKYQALKESSNDATGWGSIDVS